MIIKKSKNFLARDHQPAVAERTLYSVSICTSVATRGQWTMAWRSHCLSQKSRVICPRWISDIGTYVGFVQQVRCVWVDLSCLLFTIVWSYLETHCRQYSLINSYQFEREARTSALSKYTTRWSINAHDLMFVIFGYGCNSVVTGK